MHYQGIIWGILTLVLIGLWHPVVIKGEYYLGSRICAVLFALIGIGCLGASLYVSERTSIFLGFFGCTALWAILEVYQQEKRVAKGWFPRNPKRQRK